MSLPAHVQRDGSIPPTYKAVLGVVISHVGRKGHALKRASVAAECGVSVKTVSRAVTWLTDRKLLSVRTRYDPATRARLSNLYLPGPALSVPTPRDTSDQGPRDTSVPTRRTTKREEPTKEKEGLLSGETQEGSTNEREAPRLVREVSAEVRGEHPHQVHGDLGVGAREVPPASTGQEPGDFRYLKPSVASPGQTRQSLSKPPDPQEQNPHAATNHPHHDSMTALENVLAHLDRVRRNGNNTLASCPVASHGKGNGDREPSLSVSENDGRVLLHCMSGCHVQDVMTAAGLDWPDLFDEPVTNDRGVKVAEWTYQAKDGSPWLTVERWQTPQGKRFVQRVPGSQKPGLPAGFKPCLFQLPKVLAAAKAGEEIYLVEGEKCVAAAERLGVVATTSPAGVNGWRDYFTNWLKGCSRVTIVCDNDEPGMRYASAVAASLKGADINVRTMKVAVPDAKADLYDHVLAGHTIADLVPVRLNQFRPEGPQAAPLLDFVFPPVEWVIEDLMPIGFTVLGGAPKVGKSFITLDAALNVALGGEFLHTQRCVQGAVLYLSLDNDAQWRLQLRLRHLQMQYGVSVADADIEFHTDFPTGDGAIKGIAEWCADKREEGKRPLLVVADTLAKVEPNFDGSLDRNSMNGGYGQSTSNLSKWSQLALDQRIGVLATHHIRKSTDDDWMNRFIGSQGIVATATTLMMVDHKRGTPQANLYVSSRDAGEHELQMTRDGWSWCLVEQARPERIVTKAGLHVIPGGKVSGT